MQQNDFDGLRPSTPGLEEKHADWRRSLRQFVDQNIAPHIDAWNVAGTFPDALYQDAASAGLLGFGFPAEVGGWSEEVDLYHRIIVPRCLSIPSTAAALNAVTIGRASMV